MGQAKRRGTFEDRVAQSQQRRAEEHAKWQANRALAEKLREEEYQRRVAAGEAIPDAPRFPHRRRSSLVGIAMLAAVMANR